jgi:hypothetical protein
MRSNYGPIPDDLARRLLELSGQPTPAAKRAAKAPELVEASFLWPGIWTIPLETRNESNQRDWKARNRRAGEAWKAVRKSTLLINLDKWEGYLYHHHPICAHFVRIGGRRLDPLVGLPAALKGVEDAFCYLLGVDDGSPLWRPTCDQEPGGPMGVRVELRLVKEKE